MKRDEVYMNPQFKRPFGSSSRGESYGSPHASGGGGGAGDAGVSGGGGATGGIQKLTTNDALTYLKEVKDMFQDQKEKYDRFLDVMKDFKAQRIDTTGVILKVKELFKGHPNLILGFNTFLPKGYEITLTEEEGAPKRTVEFDEAINFVNKIKNRFQDDDRVYKDFLAILNMYRKDHKGIADVYEEVSALFIDHPDLLQQFTRFLPDTSTTDSTALASFGRHSFHRFDERSSAMPTMRHSHMDKQRLRREKIMISRGEHDPSVERPEVEEDKTVMTLHKDRKRRAERENKDKRTRYSDNRDTDNENNGDISMHHHSDKSKSAQKVDDFGGNSNMVSHDDKDALKRMYSQEFAFCEKVKERLRSADDYQAFLKCLHIYSTEIITRKELQSLIADLLGKHPDLMEGFNEFFERCEQIEGFLAGVMGKIMAEMLWNDGHSSKALRVEDKDKEKKREVDGGKEKDRPSLKYSGKSIQELDLSNRQRCTPSYRLLPEDYPMATASQRSELGAQVLNDHWVSVTSGSEDYSFKHMRRNQYEESLFRCEDDRFELDMLLESVSSAAKRAEDLLNSITDNPAGSDNPIRVEEHFTALNLRCIERLYGDHGLDVMDILRKNPSLALSVILTRLKQKQEEWTKCRADFNKVWAEIYAKNHYKSLDHRSFYFKQQDSKNLSTKSLVAEIKEIKEKNENEVHVPLDIAAGSRYSIHPNLEFEYADADIHEDLYEIIKYSSEEICSTKEQLNKVLRFYTTFLEPMLGVHSLRRSSDVNEGDGFSKIGTAKNTLTSITASDGNADATTMNLKQPKRNGNGDSNTSPQRVNSCKTSFTNMDTLAKEDGSTVASGGRLPKSDTAVTLEPDANHGRAANSSRANIDPSEDNHRSKLNMEVTLCSEGDETSRSNQLANEGCVERSRLAGYDEDYVDASRGDKEVDKISSNGNFGENIAAYQDGGSQSMADRTRGHEEISPNGAAENDADADDEDSEAGEDASGSESAADEGSGEEHEEEGDIEMDGKAESEVDAEDAGEGALIPVSERFLLPCKPLSKYTASPSKGSDGNDRRVFYGNDTFYVLFRLHQILYERILTAKMNSEPAESKLKTTKDASSDPYTRFKNALFGLLDGSSDNSKFEDDCRSLIGNQSYVLFTLDKLIYKLVKQLQTVSSDEVDYKLLQLHEYEKFRKSEHYVDLVYYENVHVLLHDENIYRVECTSSPTRLSIQLMDDGNEKSEVVPVSVDPDFADYFYNDYLSVTNGRKESSSVMLKRNMRKYANMDEPSALCLAMGNIQMNNGLECKTSATTSKISYVLDTEDSFIRLGRGRNESGVRSSNNDQARVQRFHQFLMASVIS
ncbi:paired amphipathic helix protein Sin3-like 2 isoform X1 [Olea europaea var. sylvestris]|uniref:paired amphipathic helix protein Sin3-like 2 isoform X1 n=1 Tax=Olea europaea var. sylvestris TaxID=158386 RepID=UPI000C1D6873|nr:paired amphipathic helix protein Sin3-like 2 isoform X1 [Olea europaea var. sylvestris]XP_022845042.1 paired amphipathic helix protein Sin3-like 2 isoform X1 [Olea europaea var. sylvestris]XP_022845043.1 paired amphipathic helix protein Sin3-like 2 isoform X1 [Olea europaea var. sylvestris]XP_022845044.1 paired amphipathic helix protein Sin3-like 2 isoform X1 [Olea europaea var. sylvestris]